MAQPDPPQTWLLAPAEEQAFRDIGLRPGFWEPLLPLPLVVAIHRGLVRPETSRVWDAVHYLLGSARTIFKEHFEPGTPALLHARHTALERFIIDADDSSGDGADRIARASALLAWHLAAHYQSGDRKRYFRINAAVAKNSGWPSHARGELSATVWQLQARVDRYLSLAGFCVEPLPEVTNIRTDGLTPGEAALALLDSILEGSLAVPAVGDGVRDILVKCLAMIPFEERENRFLVPRRPATWSPKIPTAGKYAKFLDELRDQVAAYRSLRSGRAPFEPKRHTLPASIVLRRPGPGIHPPASSSRPPERAIPPKGTIPETFQSQSPTRSTSPPTSLPPNAAELPDILDPPVTLSQPWTSILAEARSMTATEARQLLLRPLLFEDSLIGKPPGVVHVRDPKQMPKSLWFVGDLHGDLLALANSWAYITMREKAAGLNDPHVLFLGDFVDRGAHSHETLLYLFHLIRDHPGRIGVLPGNHDEIRWDEAAGRFVSAVSPADYVDGLNVLLDRADLSDDERERIELGKVACKFFESRPRAVFLPDGLLAAHGGFPHNDLLETLKRPDDLASPACLQDFLWLRASENAPRKRPNRGTKGCEFGFENFSEFCRRATDQLGVVTRRMLRGHEHPPTRYATYPKYRAHPILTINTMCRRLADESSTRVEQFPRACVAHHVPNRLPEVHRLRIAEADIRAVYYADSTPDRPAAVESVPTASSEGGAGG